MVNCGGYRECRIQAGAGEQRPGPPTPATLAPSFLAHIGHPGYGLNELRAGLDRFTFLLGGNDGELLLGEDP